MTAVDIREADLARLDHQQDVLTMTQALALDPMGSGSPLPPDAAARLIDGLRAHPTTLILLAYVDSRIAGIATCFVGFSTFAARPVINVHDLAVLPEFRGLGIARQLLAAVERRARDRGCAKVTLEVLENNHRARRVYEAVGFAQATGGDGTGGALFYAKKL